jgi:hypothetical protein
LDDDVIRSFSDAISYSLNPCSEPDGNKTTRSLSVRLLVIKQTDWFADPAGDAGVAAVASYQAGA